MSNEFWELTAGQLDIWYRQHRRQESPVFNVGEYLEIRGQLDIGIFEAALRRIVYETDAFHLRFAGDGEVVRQQVVKSDGWSLDIIDFSAAPFRGPPQRTGCRRICDARSIYWKGRYSGRLSSSSARILSYGIKLFIA